MNTVGGAKPRSLLLSRQNRELVPQQHQLDVLGNLGPTATDEQPQNRGKGKVGEGKEHRAILPGPTNELTADSSCTVQRSLVLARARVNLEETWQRAEPAPHTRHRRAAAGAEDANTTPTVQHQTRIGVLPPFTRHALGARAERLDSSEVSVSRIGWDTRRRRWALAYRLADHRFRGSDAAGDEQDLDHSLG